MLTVKYSCIIVNCITALKKKEKKTTTKKKQKKTLNKKKINMKNLSQLP